MDHDARFYRQIVDNLGEGVYFLDTDRRITYWNRGAEELTGFTLADVQGKCCSNNILMHVTTEGVPMCATACPVQAVLDTGEEQAAEVFLHHKKGHRVPVKVRAFPIHDADGEVVGAVETFDDNSAELAAREKTLALERLALVDDLTGVGNRRYLEARLRAKLDQVTRYGWPLGVVFVDVDHFKGVNDVHGHAAGDEVLKVVARTMEHASRSFDVVGRWGGEEFIAGLTSLEPPEAVHAAERLRALIETATVPVNGEHLRVTVSVGVTCALPGDSLESLVERADQLMYASKQAGRNRVTTDVEMGNGERKEGKA